MWRQIFWYKITNAAIGPAASFFIKKPEEVDFSETVVFLCPGKGRCIKKTVI
jgi:hypothetical protein